MANYHNLGLRKPSETQINQTKQQLISNDVASLKGWNEWQMVILAEHWHRDFRVGLFQHIEKSETHLGLYRLSYHKPLNNLIHTMTWERLGLRHLQRIKTPNRTFLEAADSSNVLQTLDPEDRQYTASWIAKSWKEVWRRELMGSLGNGSRLRWTQNGHPLTVTVTQTHSRGLPEFTDEQGRSVSAASLIHGGFEVMYFHP